MSMTDRNGYSIDEYPENYLDGIFLGINGDGIGEYLRSDYVFLAEYTPRGLLVPPKEYGIAHEFYLEDMPLEEYIIAIAEEVGPWRHLTEISKQSLQNSGYDPHNFLKYPRG